jgi:hypothetical protein
MLGWTWRTTPPGSQNPWTRLTSAGFAAWNLATTFGPLELVGSAFAASGNFSPSLGTLVVTVAKT